MKRTRRILSALLAAAMLFSLLPATAFAAAETRSDGVTIDVTEYGADPTGVKESSTAVKAALAAAKALPEGTQKTIAFPQGEYHFYEDYSETRELYASNTLRWDERSYADKHIGILVEGMKNVTIDGGGSLFIYHGNVCTVAAIDSENVTFTNFSEDFASPEVVDVTVESHEGDNAAILFIPACYNFTVSGTNINWQGEISPVTGQPYWSGDNGFLSYRQYLDTVTGRSSSGGTYPFSNVSSITKVDDTHIKVVYSNANSRPPVGQCCQMRHPNPRKTPGVFFLNSKDITLSNANFHFLHGFGMVGQLSENITLDTVKCQPRPGTGRTSAGFADFVQMSSIAGKVTIRNCEFADPHDDPINIHGTFLEVQEITADRRRVVVKYMHGETWGFPQYNVGDTVDFSVKDTMAPAANSTRTVVGVVNPGEGLNLNGTARSKNNENDMRTIIVELDEPLPNSISANHDVMENVTHTPEVLIENCRFTETPTRGILVTTRKPVVIRNNYFDRICSSSIFISCDAQDWRESGHSEDVLITGNTFIAENTTGLGDHYGGTGIIMIWPTNPSDDPNYQIHKNIRIEDNVFSLLPMGAAKRAIVAKSVNGLTVKNNLFQRYTPNVTLTLAAGSTALTAGGTQSTTLTNSGSTFANKLLRLQACKNVTMEGNAYDDGLNLGVQLDGNVVTAADVTDNDGVLAIGGDNQLPAVGAVRYFSSDPAVAVVDESGVVTGVSAGTAEIYAYRVAGARTFESNHLTFTVTGTAAVKPNKIDITSDKDAVDVNGTATLTAVVDPANAGSVTWAVKPVTDGAAATITQSGVLTGTAPGVVEVTASLGGVTASKLITVNKPSFVYLSDLNWTSATTGDSWSPVPLKDRSWESEKDGNPVYPIKLTGSNGEEVTFEKGIGTHAASTITYNLAGLGYTRFTAKVGVSYYKHNSSEPHLYFVVNGDGNQKFASSEMLGNTPYEEVDVDITNVNILELKLTQPTNVWSAHGNWADAKLLTDNAAPTASGVAAAAGSGEVTLNYTYADENSDAEDGSLIAWYVSDTQDGHYTRLENGGGTTLPVTVDVSEKWVKAVVVPRDTAGRYGAPVASAAVQAPAQTPVQDDATLRSLSVAGVALSPAFDPSVTAYTINVPRSAGKVTIAAAASQAAATVAGRGEVALTGTETVANVTVTAPNGTTTKTYTITIRRAVSSDATLSGLTVSAGSAAITYNASTRFYELVADQTAKNLTFSAAAADAGAEIKVRFNAEEKGTYENAPKTLPLTAGLNNLELRVTAADGISTALYRVAVMKPAATDANLSSLSVNGTNVLSDLEDGEGLVRLDGNTATLSAAAADPSATVLISVDGKPVANGGSVTLTEAVATANIRVIAEDTVTEKIYTLVLTKNDPASADLAVLKLDGMTLSPAFDPNVTEYTATDYGYAKAALTAIAAQAGASVTYETAADYESATGQVSGDCRFFKDERLVNKVIVTVTSPSGANTKTYTITVDVVESAYLSDLPWVSATSGWQSVRRDYDVDPDTNNRLSLLENNQTVTYDKGLGTHANSVIEYDLSSMGFTRFTAKVGMDHSQASANTTQRLRFYVDLDGTNQYVSSQQGLGSTTNCETVDIDITDVEQMILRVVYTTANDANAHADWADAKLSSSIPLLSDTTDVPIKHLEFEHHDEHVIYVNGDDKAHDVELHPIFKPDGVVPSAHAISLNWQSEDTAIATVAAGANRMGLVTAVAPGKVEITATANSGATASCFITVKKIVEGAPSVTGRLQYGVELTATDNDFDPNVRENLTYTWYRGEGTSGTVLGTGKTYTPVEEDIGSKLTVKAAAREGTFYEGEAAFTTAAITKADGPQMRDVLRSTDASAANAADGTITGLFKGQHYEYLLWNDGDTRPGEDAVWTPFCDDTGTETPGSAPGSAVITGLGAGTYLVRRAGSSTHNPGPYRAVTISVMGTVEYDLNNDTHFDGGDVETVRSKVAAYATVTIRVKPDTGYELDTLTATPEGGTAITPTEDTSAPGTYTFTMPAAAVTISATFRLKTYTIGHNLTNISCNMDEHNHTATHGTEFTIRLTPDEGYDMPRALTVTAGNEPFTGRYTYNVDPDDSARRLLSFPDGVTCDVTVSGVAVLKTYTVVYELTNGLTASGSPQTATHGKRLSAALAADEDHTLPGEITVKMAGVELTTGYTYNAGSGEIIIENVTGNVVIIAQGEALGVDLQSVAIIGPAQVGRTLSANTVPVLATVDYQWILVDEDGTETPIDGATGNRYVIPEEAEGKAIRVRVTGTGGYNGTAISDPTAAVLPRSEPFVFVTSITLGTAEASVPVDGTVRIGATVEPDNATSGILYWSSSDDTIATVDQNGVVTGVAEGMVTITARSTDTVNFVSAECVVTVTEKQQVVTPPPQIGPVGGGILPPPTTTTVVENPDGSTTTTVTDNRTGTVTETTENPDGSTETVETKKDGTVTATTIDTEGGKAEKIVTPDEDVTITVTDPEGEVLAKVEIPAVIPESPIQFVDVPEGHWAESAINQAAGLGLVQGVGGSRFDWNANMKRGDLAVVLRRLSNGSEGCELTFEDVPADKYYAGSVAWAAATKVVMGTSDTEFAPESSITREELAVMLYRYAQLLKLDTATSGDVLDAFNDGGNVNSWAEDGMAWCVENGIITGMGGDTLAPGANTTRAEVTLMLQRFMGLMK